MAIRARLPRLIVFDLDHTLWPFGVDAFKYKPPYHRINSKVFDSENKQMIYFPEVPQVLNHLNTKDFNLGVASRTTYPTGAHSLIDLFGWNLLIKYREIYPGSKLQHFANLKIKSGFSYKQMLFFDDETRNIDEVQKLGVVSILVDRDIGITEEIVEQSLKQFQTNSSL